MRKVIAAINMTLDGFCDHTAGIADDELHEHFNDLLRNAGTLIYGRTTYQLMESHWPTVVKAPTGNKSTDDFAVLIENIHKVVFSRTLKKVDWKNVELATRDLKEEVLALKEQPGKDICAGSPSLIAQLTKLNLIDEYILCVHPVILEAASRCFRASTSGLFLNLLKQKLLALGW